MSEPTPPELDAFEHQPSRYIVGIDLGTTNCAVAYVDTQAATGMSAGSAPIENFPVRQWVDAGVAEDRELLPSFLYQPLSAEQTLLAGLDRPLLVRAVGCMARDRGLQLPGRQIASAKSWLCHDGVDRRSPILPWQNEDDVEKISPVSASAEILAQIVWAWNRVHPHDHLADQEIVLTLPASFDQVARQLTIEAAGTAGLTRILPIEEPQAAFYAWLARHAEDWERKVAAGQTILVCDIGGGTTDFTLIRVRETTSSPDGDSAAISAAETLGPEHRQRLSLHRVAVGQHLILGGDNIDLALARLAEQKLTGGASLSIRHWDALRQACRQAKESLLGDALTESATLYLPGSGSRLIGGGQQVELTRAEVQACVLEGFFPHCPLEARPDNQQTGFQEFGLPFARDAAITKHLAHFLWEHRWDGRDPVDAPSVDQEIAAARPDWILFNGGVMSSSQLRTRILEVVASWFANRAEIAQDWIPQVLDGERFDLAVARGAAYFGQVRRGCGIEIEAKLACSYYIQTSTEPPRAICIVPGSASPGDHFQLSDQSMELAIGQPVQFPIVYSSTRLADRMGQTVTIDEEHFSRLPPIRTVIQLSGSRRQSMLLPVYVETELTQIGTVQMYCHARDTNDRWKLEFDVRGSTQTDHSNLESHGNEAGVVDERLSQVARSVFERIFTSSADQVQPSHAMRVLAESLEMRKSQWPPHLLRAMWSGLMDLQEGRRLSPQHEARWLNLVGYTLRPGYGLAADDWRVAQTWRTVHGKLAFAAASSRNESLILWRRIAGGFTTGQQLTVYQQVAGPLRSVLDPLRRQKGSASLSPQELTELLRLVGSLELLPRAEKRQLGDWLVELLSIKRWSACNGALLWAIGRLGNRVPTYGPLNCVVDPQSVETWLADLCRLRLELPEMRLALMLCARKVEDRYRDISNSVREQVLARLQSMHAPPHAISLVSEGGRLAGEETEQVLGESLPFGLTLRG